MKLEAEERLELLHSLKASSRSAEVLLHELQVYQIELEMQNEQLREQSAQLQANRHELERRVAERTAELHASNQLLRQEIEARKQTEGLLRQAKEFAEGVINALPEPSFEISRDGRYLNVWAQTSVLFGVPKESLLGKTVYEVLSPEAAVLVMSAIREAEAAGHSYGKVLPIQFPSAMRLFELSIAKYPGGDLANGSFVVLSRDITERKQEEETLALREREFRTLAENLPDYIVRYDRQGRKTYLNPASLGLFAEDAAGLIGQTPEESHAARAATSWPEEIGSTLQRVLKSGEPEEIEVSFDIGNASGRIHALRFVAERGAHGEFDGVMLIGRDITDRKLYEQSLLARAEHGQFMYNITANLPGFVYTCRKSPDGNFCLPYISPSIREAFGLEPRELAKDIAPIAALVPQEYQSLIQEQAEKAAREMSLFSCTFPMNVPGGGKRWILARSMPHREADGSVLRYGVMLDVTEQRHLEQQLEFKQFALDRAYEAFYVIGANSRFVYINEEACRALGYSREELLGLTVSDIDPDFTPEMREAFLGKLASEGGACFESWHRRRDGSVFPVEIRTALFEYQGQIFAVAQARDMTEQKRAEESIAAREREFRTLAQSLPDNIVRYDRNGIVVYVNAALERTLGEIAADMIGMGVRGWFNDGRFEAYAQTLDLVLATGIDREIEISMPDPRVHSDVIHQIRFVTERDENGIVIGALAIGRDISALKRSERELEASRSQLRGLAARREEELEAERKRIAREVHDELGQVLTGLQMKISRLARKCVHKCSVPDGDVHDAIVLSEKALDVARNVASALRPAVLDMGIATALEWLADQFATDTGIHCKIHIVGEDIQLNESQAIALFRITQESLTNIARHAQADRVDIVLSKCADKYILKIRDNGIGFEGCMRKLGSFGLIGIQERALILGGEAEFDGSLSLGRGTEVVVRIPIKRKREVC